MSVDAATLETCYRTYLDLINQHKLSDSDLAPFVQDNVTHNGRTMTRAEYGKMILDNGSDTPALTFNVGLLAIQGDMLACQIIFRDGSEEGFVFQGRRVFTEHVFYKMEDGRIRQVWSKV
jgi:predicted ester cyclase